MTYAQQQSSTEHAKAKRKEGGAWLKRCRQEAGLTQKELADRVGFDYYTFISQIESGAGRVPDAAFAAYSRALNIPRDEFSEQMLRYYSPIIYEGLKPRLRKGKETSSTSKGKQHQIA